MDGMGKGIGYRCHGNQYPYHVVAMVTNVLKCPVVFCWVCRSFNIVSDYRNDWNLISIGYKHDYESGYCMYL